MHNKICQSCGMPILNESDFRTNADDSKNEDFCKYCFKNGEFIDDVSMQEYIEMCSQHGKQANMSNEEMRIYCTSLFQH